MKEQASQHLLKGKVVSDKMQNTIVVEIEQLIKHKLYKKYLRRSIRIKADDRANSAKLGDIVSIKQCRPIAKGKSWKLEQVLSKA